MRVLRFIKDVTRRHRIRSGDIRAELGVKGIAIRGDNAIEMVRTCQKDA